MGTSVMMAHIFTGQLGSALCPLVFALLALERVV